MTPFLHARGVQGALREDAIRISQHAHVRGWDRLGLALHERRAAVLTVLQTGSWYNHPDEVHAFLVLGRVGRHWLCVIAKVDQQVHVTTVYPMTNARNLDRFKRHNPGGPLTAGEIARHYGLG